MLEDIAGMGFPFNIDESSGSVSWASGAEKIRHNVRVILGTRHGERPMLRDFGTRIHSLAHDPNDDVLADLLVEQVRQGLLTWEPRIIITGATIERSGAEVQLRVTYTHTSEIVQDEMIIPLR